MLYRTLFLQPFLAGLLALVFLLPVSAESPATDDPATDAGSRTYVVTASRDDEDLMSAPASVTVITAADIEASGKTSLVQILESVSGLTFRSYSGESEAQVSMRGFGENSFGRVVVLVDGKRLNNPDMRGLSWLSIPVGSIERIEILDGPSSVLYGSGAIGGVINIITKETAGKLTADATVSWGSFDTRRMLINGGYGFERAGFLISADVFRTEGARERSGARDTNVAVTSYWDVTDKLTVKPSFSYADIATELPGSLTKAQFEDDPSQALNSGDENTERDVGGGLKMVLAASDDLSFEMPLSYLYKERTTDLLSWFSYANLAQHQWEGKPQLTYTRETGAGPLRLVGGVDLEASFFDSTSYSDPDRTTIQSDFEVDQWVGSPYLSGTLAVTGALAATAGLRYNYASITAVKDSSSFDESDEYRDLVYDLAMNWSPSKTISAYVKYGTLFRYPFIDEKAEVSGFGVDRFNADLRPETGWNVETGAKIRLNDRLTAACNLYFMRLEDEIAYTTHNVNLDKTDRIGGSVQARIVPSNMIEVNANVSYVRAVFAAGDFKGELLSFIPELTGGADARLTLPGGLSLGSDLTFTRMTEAWSSSAPELSETIEPYWLLGLSAGFVPASLEGKLALRFRMDNALDTRYPGFVYPATPFSVTAYYPAAGRTMQVSATYRY